MLFVRPQASTFCDFEFFFFQISSASARCDFGLFAGASSENATTLPSLAHDAVALKMYLNETYTTLRMKSVSTWMQVGVNA